MGQWVSCIFIAKPDNPAPTFIVAFIWDTCLPRLPGGGRSPCSQLGWPPWGVLALWLSLQVQTVAVVSSKAGCVWNGGGELGSGIARETREHFSVVPVSSPPQTHRHQGPESLGEGDGTDQIFPLIPQPCNLAHLIGPTHPEGNSSPKSCPEFSLWSASSALGVGSLLGQGTPLRPLSHEEERGLLREDWCGPSWAKCGAGHGGSRNVKPEAEARTMRVVFSGAPTPLPPHSLDTDADCPQPQRVCVCVCVRSRACTQACPPHPALALKGLQLQSYCQHKAHIL